MIGKALLSHLLGMGGYFVRVIKGDFLAKPVGEWDAFTVSVSGGVKTATAGVERPILRTGAPPRR